MANAIDTLEANTAFLNSRDQDFARSLIQQCRQRGLSAKQSYWVDTLNTRAEQARLGAPVNAVEVGDFKGVFELFQKASQKLSAKKMKIRLQTEEGQKVALFLPERGKYAGNVYVTNGASYSSGASVFFGHVSPDGMFTPSQRASASITALLLAMATSPAETAAKYGKLTGQCCFCGKGLDDPRSLKVGYGPVCAGNYGLPWGEAGDVQFEQPQLALETGRHAWTSTKKARYEELKNEYGLVVDSDDVNMIKPIVDEMRQLELRDRRAWSNPS